MCDDGLQRSDRLNERDDDDDDDGRRQGLATLLYCSRTLDVQLIA